MSAHKIEDISIDTHVDSVLAIVDYGHDLVSGQDGDYISLPTMKAGGLTAAFFAAWTGSEGGSDAAWARIARQLDTLERFADVNAGLVGIARSASDIRRLHEDGRSGIVLCVENGEPIGERLDMIPGLAERGIRYVTLTHFAANSWCDSSTAPEQFGGLSRLGRRAVATLEANGVAVDLSHVSDKTFWQVMESSAAAPMASHSCVRSITAHPRNLSNEMLAALGERNGFVGIAFWPEYVSERFLQALEAHVDGRDAQWRTQGSSAIGRLLADVSDEEVFGVIRDLDLPWPDMADVADHIDAAVAAAGIDHVGIGSDHGAIAFPMKMLMSAAELPNLRTELARRGYDKTGIDKILGGNILSYLERLGR
ncbi:MAG: dipeptidase [Mesorhizobium sp.]